MSAPFRGAEDLPSLLEDDLPTQIFNGRLPDPSEVVQWGGRPGCLYAFVSDTKASIYRRAGWAVAQGTDRHLREVIGPKGSCVIYVLVRGKPITSADPANGIRHWFVDPAIYEMTGLESAYPTTKTASTPELTEPPAPKSLPRPALKSSTI